MSNMIVAVIEYEEGGDYQTHRFIDPWNSIERAEGFTSGVYEGAMNYGAGSVSVWLSSDIEDADQDDEFFELPKKKQAAIKRAIKKAREGKS